MRLDGLILNTSFTLEFWIYPEADGSLLAVNGYADFDLESAAPRIERDTTYASGLTIAY